MKNKLAEIRRDKGITQAELSRKAGVSRPYISNIERGRQDAVTNIVMQKLATALNRRVEDIFFIDDVV